MPFRRNLTPFNAFGITFTTVGVLLVFSSDPLHRAFVNGGPAVVVWGWVVASSLNVVTALCLSELAACMPAAVGSLYFFTARLAPWHSKAFATWVAAWANMSAGLATTTYYALATTRSLVSAARLARITEAARPYDSADPHYDLSPLHQFAIYCGVLLSWLLLIAAPLGVTAACITATSLWQVFGGGALFSSLLALSPAKHPASWVLTGWYIVPRISGIRNVPYNVLLGLVFPITAQTGYENVLYFVEELLVHRRRRRPRNHRRPTQQGVSLSGGAGGGGAGPQQAQGLRGTAGRTAATAATAAALAARGAGGMKSATGSATTQGVAGSAAIAAAGAAHSHLHNHQNHLAHNPHTADSCSNGSWPANGAAAAPAPGAVLRRRSTPAAAAVPSTGAEGTGPGDPGDPVSANLRGGPAPEGDLGSTPLLHQHQQSQQHSQQQQPHSQHQQQRNGWASGHYVQLQQQQQQQQQQPRRQSQGPSDADGRDGSGGWRSQSVLPESMAGGLAASCALALFFILLLLAATPSLSHAVDPYNETLGQDPMSQIVYDILKATYGTGRGSFGLISVIAVGLYGSGMVCTAGTCRKLWAMAADGFVPPALSRVSPTSHVPVRAALAVTGVSLVPGLLLFASEWACGAVLSFVLVATNASYLLPVALRLLPASSAGYEVITRRVGGSGGFTLGRASRPLFWVASIWLVISILLAMLPPAWPLRADTANWAPVSTAAVAAAVLGSWWLPYWGARRWFRGLASVGGVAYC